jgi:hypothetical protein
MVREVQFLIERECPEPGDEPTNLTEYPAAVFVEWPPVDGLPRAPTPCSSKSFYRLLRREARRLGYTNLSDGWYVCEHMGHLIE